LKSTKSLRIEECDESKTSDPIYWDMSVIAVKSEERLNIIIRFTTKLFAYNKRKIEQIKDLSIICSIFLLNVQT